MRLALFGYGKMGKEIEKIALLRHHEIALKIDIHNRSGVVQSDLQKCDAAIEFSTPQSAVENINKCFEAGIPVVVGTTGWYDKAEEIKVRCKEKNGCLFYSSNFSIGVNIFSKLNEHLAKIMNNHKEYNVSIEEIHHIHKLDAPSGTAITLANGIINNLERKSKWHTVTEQKKRGNGETVNVSDADLLITSKREGEVPGTHIVKYHSAIDDIEIKHTAHNRQGFAMGAVLAAEFVKGKKGIYGMNDLMGV